MLVFWKARLVLLAVPKTGTSAYETALGPHASMSVLDPPELKHAPVYRYNRFFRPMFEKMGVEHMELMAVVREPVSWLGSWYRYRQRDFLDGKPTSTRDLSFEQFVEAYTSGERPPFANVGSQAKFVEPRPNGTEVSHLFRYEHQAEIAGFLEERLGVRLDLPRENVSPRADLALSPATEAKLRRKCAADFALWERAR
ncbi:gamma-glutamyl kinase [Salipiger pacificus]|nr:gamma-glutamyl kinase [Alloyangia pacifica]MCA0946002.1 gamma-glutamyl kinase [Alloyangia pacifica]